MNPFEEYLSIVLFWQHNPPAEGVACQVHHIIPKSCGGPDEEWNKVRLPVKEHYNCHKLLPLIYTGEAQLKMVKAWHRMHFSEDGTEITAEEYERLMTLHAEAQRQKAIGNQWHAGKTHSEESRKLMSDHRKGIATFSGKQHTEESKRKVSESHKKHPSVRKDFHHSEESKRKLSEAAKGRTPWMKGRKHTEETKAKMRAYWANRRKTA